MYIAVRMLLIKKIGGKFTVLAIVLCVAVVLCSIDHTGPTVGNSEHADAVSSGCLSDVCQTLTSKDSSFPGKTAGFILLLTFILTAEIASFSMGQLRFLKPSSNGRNQVSKAFNKLYRLHAAYRI